MKETSVSTHVGGMRCHTVYTPSGSTFTTDVVASLGGKGEQPTPGDMLASCVASCMVSMIAYTGAKKGFKTDGIVIKASCGEGKQGVGSLNFDITIPMPTTPIVRTFIEGAVKACPVGNSLHPDIPKNIVWHWAE